MQNSESGTRQALEAAGQMIDKLGVVDLAIPALRRQLERIDVDELVDDAIDYIKRKPEVLVVLFGTLTITSGLLLFLAKQTGDVAEAGRRVAATDDDEDDRKEHSRKRSNRKSSGHARSSR